MAGFQFIFSSVSTFVRPGGKSERVKKKRIISTILDIRGINCEIKKNESAKMKGIDNKEGKKLKKRYKQTMRKKLRIRCFDCHKKTVYTDSINAKGNVLKFS